MVRIVRSVSEFRAAAATTRGDLPVKAASVGAAGKSKAPLVSLQTGRRAARVDRLRSRVDPRGAEDVAMGADVSPAGPKRKRKPGVPDPAAGKDDQAQGVPAAPALKRKPALKLLDPPDVDLGRKLGCGGFGTVYEARCKRTGNLYAEKRIPVKRDAKAELCEVKEQSRFRHRHIVQALWATIDGKSLRIGLEILPGGSLHDLLANGGLEEEKVAHYARQLALGVTHLHGKLTVHRDLKASNLLLSADRRELKIADFGLARRLRTIDEEVDGRCGTLEWMAPEALFAKRAGLPSDVWSVGCTVWEMAMGARPWSYRLKETDAENERLLRSVVRRPQTARLPDNLSPLGRQFIRGCMQSRRASRPRALHLLDTPFLDADATAVRKRGRDDELVEESIGKRYKDEDFDL